MKKLVVIGLLILGGLFVLKKTKVGSYVCTVWENGRASIAKHVPRQLELDRVRNEIARIDGDIQAMLSPIAKKKVAIKRLEREINTAEDNLKDQRAALLDLTRKVEAGDEQVTYKGEDYTLEEAKVRLANDFTFCKRCDARVKNQKKLLAAHTEHLRAITKQLDRLVEQKKEFELRLLECETTQAHLDLQRLATPGVGDPSRAADIDETLNLIKRLQEEEQTENELRQQYNTRGTVRPRSSSPALNLSEIRTFLGEGNSSSRVVKNN